MPRSTQITVGPKSELRCHSCNAKAEASITNGSITIRVCAVHVVNYVRNTELSIILDPDARTAICPNCSLVVGHNGRAAHRCES